MGNRQEIINGLPELTKSLTKPKKTTFSGIHLCLSTTNAIDGYYSSRLYNQVGKKGV
jgi:hypothetical protein